VVVAISSGARVPSLGGAIGGFPTRIAAARRATLILGGMRRFSVVVAMQCSSAGPWSAAISTSPRVFTYAGTVPYTATDFPGMTMAIMLIGTLTLCRAPHPLIQPLWVVSLSKV